MDKIKIVFLGGLSHAGTNLCVVEINNDMFVLSCGCGYPDKFTPGVDFVIADFSYIEKNKDKLRAYIISHAHDDEFGALPYIYERVPAPIYTTPFTQVAFNIFGEKYSQKHKYEFVTIDPSGEAIIANRKFDFFETSHNSPDSFGVAIHTDQGNIIFSSDFIIQYTIKPHFSFNLNKLIRICSEPTLALFIDAGCADRQGYTSPSHRIKEKLQRTIENSEGRVFIASYMQNIYSLCEILDGCLENNRFVCFFDKYTEFTFQALLLSGIIKFPFNKVIKIDDLNKKDPSEVAVIINSNGSSLYDKLDALAVGDSNVTSLKLEKTDTVIVIAPPAPNFEVAAINTLDDVYRCNCNLVTFSRSDFVKMHPSREDLKIFISIVKPKHLFPYKGDYKECMSCVRLARRMEIGINENNSFAFEDGIVLNFENEKLSVSTIDDCSVGLLMVDKSGIGNVEGKVIAERNSMSTDGILIISCLASKKKRIITGGPDLQARGFLYIKDSEAILKGVQELYIEMINEFLTNTETFDFMQISEKIKTELSKYCRKTTLRNPVISPYILFED